MIEWYEHWRKDFFKLNFNHRQFVRGSIIWTELRDNYRGWKKTRKWQLVTSEQSNLSSRTNACESIATSINHRITDSKTHRYRLQSAKPAAAASAGCLAIMCRWKLYIRNNSWWYGHQGHRAPPNPSRLTTFAISWVILGRFPPRFLSIFFRFTGAKSLHLFFTTSDSSELKRKLIAAALAHRDISILSAVGYCGWRHSHVRWGTHVEVDLFTNNFYGARLSGFVHFGLKQ